MPGRDRSLTTDQPPARTILTQRAGSPVGLTVRPDCGGDFLERNITQILQAELLLFIYAGAPETFSSSPNPN